ncbi:MAG: glycine zipper family protein [Blastocatellia bacterium]|nr:glycine zipper family protein [Blastocatellia bacterium]
MGNKRLSIFAILISTLLGVATISQAQYTYRVNERQVQSVLRRIETRTDTFRTTIERNYGQSRTNDSRYEAGISTYVDAFENATDELRSDFNSGRATSTDVSEVLRYGWYIDDFMRRSRLPRAPQRQWQLIKTDLNQLSRLYSVSWNWYQTLPPFPQDRWGQNNRLDGTYRLNVSQSDDINNVVTRTISNSTIRDRQRQNLTRRLSAPQTIAIETSGNQVTMATDRGSRVTMTADGRAVTETNNRGRTTTTRVSMVGRGLTIQTQGDRNNDYTVTFSALSGNRLRVTRSLYLENQNQMITATSVYDRIATVANWPPVNERPDWNNGSTAGGFLIPNGTRLTAVLRNRIMTNVSQAGDPFSMEITSPSRYAGAIINGRITQAGSSGRITGRANLTMELQSIQYQGRTYSFAGIIDSARENDGDIISVSNEGTIRDDSQTTRTVTRTGIGAALGALIGAIISGGDGAAIGAGVGAGAGAGSVLIQGRNNLQLEPGTEFTLTATGPTNVGYRY